MYKTKTNFYLSFELWGLLMMVIVILVFAWAREYLIVSGLVILWISALIYQIHNKRNYCKYEIHNGKFIIEYGYGKKVEGKLSDIYTIIEVGNIGPHVVSKIMNKKAKRIRRAIMFKDGTHEILPLSFNNIANQFIGEIEELRI